ncbi:hypothetical protein GCM10022196_28930 [Aeromicrobium flavum]
MTDPLEIVGADEAPVCVDGVCAVPPTTDGATEEQGSGDL